MLLTGMTLTVAPKRHLNVMPSEFDLIRRYFTHPTRHTDLGVGDDAALLRPAPGMQLAVSTDMLVCGTHFLPDTDPQALGWKALAVNLSDLAAMSATPRWSFLSLSLPAPDETWIAAFACGFIECAEAFDVDLAGGDTTRGPLNLCITVFGEVRPGHALRRDAAQAGHHIYLTGRTGEARLALALIQGADWAIEHAHKDALAQVRERLDRPTPRLAMGQALAAINQTQRQSATNATGAIAAIDVSDGLAGDLAHILAASGAGAELHWAQLPIAPALARLPPAWQQECLLRGGDDYELVFTAAPEHHAAICAAAKASQTPLRQIGRVTTEPGLFLLDAKGQRTALATRGFDHFV